ncbi:exodeoxyribonuclease VII small subunit [Candidatus Saccharibacteria bacterium]|nr:exodeoxyribonuclease VII small subunit [Candidatus Saccharibacteria bacterium]
MTSKNKTIEERIAALEQAVAWFESDEFTLGEAVERYQQVQQQAATIQTELAELRHTITVATAQDTQGAQGEAGAADGAA